MVLVIVVIYIEIVDYFEQLCIFLQGIFVVEVFYGQWCGYYFFDVGDVVFGQGLGVFGVVFYGVLDSGEIVDQYYVMYVFFGFLLYYVVLGQIYGFFDDFVVIEECEIGVLGDGLFVFIQGEFLDLFFGWFSQCDFGKMIVWLLVVVGFEYVQCGIDFVGVEWIEWMWYCFDLESFVQVGCKDGIDEFVGDIGLFVFYYQWYWQFDVLVVDQCGCGVWFDVYGYVVVLEGLQFCIGILVYGSVEIFQGFFEW